LTPQEILSASVEPFARSPTLWIASRARCWFSHVSISWLRRGRHSRLTAINRSFGWPYHFRPRSQHEYAKPPATMANPMPSTPDNQAPTVPPTAKLASNQKIQLAKLLTTAISPLEGVAAQT